MRNGCSREMAIDLKYILTSLLKYLQNCFLGTWHTFMYIHTYIHMSICFINGYE